MLGNRDWWTANTPYPSLRPMRSNELKFYRTRLDEELRHNKPRTDRSREEDGASRSRRRTESADGHASSHRPRHHSSSATAREPNMAPSIPTGVPGAPQNYTHFKLPKPAFVSGSSGDVGVQQVGDGYPYHPNGAGHRVEAAQDMSPESKRTFNTYQHGKSTPNAHGRSVQMTPTLHPHSIGHPSTNDEKATQRKAIPSQSDKKKRDWIKRQLARAEPNRNKSKIEDGKLANGQEPTIAVREAELSPSSIEADELRLMHESDEPMLSPNLSADENTQHSRSQPLFAFSYRDSRGPEPSWLGTMGDNQYPAEMQHGTLPEVDHRPTRGPPVPTREDNLPIDDILSVLKAIEPRILSDFDDPLSAAKRLGTIYHHVCQEFDKIAKEKENLQEQLLINEKFLKLNENIIQLSSKNDQKSDQEKAKLVQDYNYLQAEHNETLKKLTTSNRIAEVKTKEVGTRNIEIQNLKNTLAKHESEKRSLKEIYENNLQIAMAQHKEELENNYQIHRQAMQFKHEELQEKGKQHQAALDDVNKRYEDQKGHYRNKITQKDQEQELAKKKMEARMDEQVQELKQKHAEAEDNLTRKHETQMNEMNANHANELNGLKGMHSETCDQLDTKIKELQAEREDLRDKIKHEFEERERKLKALHAHEEANFKLVEKNYQNELIKKQWKGMADNVIEQRFRKLSTVVEQFSRCPWDKKRQSKWPISETMMNMSGNDRELRKNFILNSIWVILYDQIFNSPFEMFGIEGKKLFENWVSVYGKDSDSQEAPHWPPPDLESEESRYKEMEALKNAVQAPDSAVAELRKEAYVQTIHDTSAAIIGSLERVLSISAGQRKTAEDIAREAAKIWMDFSIQRCRLILVIPLDNVGSSRLTGFLKLETFVLKPTLLRFGDSQGRNLQQKVVVFEGLTCSTPFH